MTRTRCDLLCRIRTCRPGAHIVRVGLWLWVGLCLATCPLAQVRAEPDGPSGDNQAAQAGQPTAVFNRHAAGVTALEFALDGRQIVSISSADVRFWDPTNGAEARAIQDLGGWVTAISQDLRSLAVAGREQVSIYDLADGKARLRFDPHGVWDRTFPFRPLVAALAFSPDGRRLATAGSQTRVGGSHGYPGGVIAIWDSQSGQAIHRFDRLSTGGSAVAFSPDGKLLVAGTNGAGGELPEPASVHVWDVETGRSIRSFQVAEEALPGVSLSAADVAFSPDGKWVAAGVSNGSRGRPAGLLTRDQPSVIRIWELATGRHLASMTGHPNWISQIAFSPDGQQLAAAGGSGRVQVWATDSGKALREFNFVADRIDALRFSPDGRWLAAGRNDRDKPGEIRVWRWPVE